MRRVAEQQKMPSLPLLEALEQGTEEQYQETEQNNERISETAGTGARDVKTGTDSFCKSWLNGATTTNDNAPANRTACEKTLHTSRSHNTTALMRLKAVSHIFVAHSCSSIAVTLFNPSLLFHTPNNRFRRKHRTCCNKSLLWSRGSHVLFEPDLIIPNKNAGNIALN